MNDCYKPERLVRTALKRIFQTEDSYLRGIQILIEVENSEIEKFDLTSLRGNTRFRKMESEIWKNISADELFKTKEKLGKVIVTPEDLKPRQYDHFEDFFKEIFRE